MLIISASHVISSVSKRVMFPFKSSCIVLYCIEGVVIAAQCTVTFSDLLGSTEFKYY